MVNENHQKLVLEPLLPACLVVYKPNMTKTIKASLKAAFKIQRYAFNYAASPTMLLMQVINNHATILIIVWINTSFHCIFHQWVLRLVFCTWWYRLSYSYTISGNVKWKSAICWAITFVRWPNSYIIRTNGCISWFTYQILIRRNTTGFFIYLHVWIITWNCNLNGTFPI